MPWGVSIDCTILGRHLPPHPPPPSHSDVFSLHTSQTGSHLNSHQTLTHWLNAGTVSQALAQHYNSIESMSVVRCEITSDNSKSRHQ